MSRAIFGQRKSRLGSEAEYSSSSEPSLRISCARASLVANSQITRDHLGEPIDVAFPTLAQIPSTPRGPEELDPAGPISETAQEPAENEADEEHVHEKPGYKKTLLWSMQALAVIHANHGTGLLLVFSTIFAESKDDPAPSDIRGAFCLVFWTLTFLQLLKNLIACSADDNEQGGAFAAYSLICRNVNINGYYAGVISPDDELRIRPRDKREKGDPQRRMMFTFKSFFQRLLESTPMLQTTILVVVILGLGIGVVDCTLTPVAMIYTSVDVIRYKAPALGDGWFTLLIPPRLLSAPALFVRP